MYSNIIQTSLLRMAFAFSLLIPTLSVSAQLCDLPPYELVTPPGSLPANGQYGRSILTHGDWLFVGANLPNPGAVHVFKLDNGAYAFQQMLQPTGANEPTSFGASLAADGDRLLIGTRIASAVGAAYVFSFNGTSWVQEQKLQPFGPGDPRGFGWSVAIQGSLAVVSARSILNDGVNAKGAAFVFEHNGKVWAPVQRLTNDVPLLSDVFGSTVAIGNNTILVGAPRATSSTPAVFVFELEEGEWALQYKLHGEGAGLDGYGSSMAIDGDILVVGGAFGSEHAYHFNGEIWELLVDLLPSDYLPPGNPADFGVSLAVKDSTILVGSSMHNVVRPYYGGPPYTSFSAGSVYVYNLNPNQRGTREPIFETHRLELYQPIADGIFGYGPYPCWQSGPQPTSWGSPSNLNQAHLGLAVAISTQGYFASSRLVRPQCWGYESPEDAGAVNLFATDWKIGDCNMNGIADACEIAPDCNGNDVPDECDPSSDCNNNSTPDECESEFTYRLDSAYGIAAWYAAAGNGNADIIWLNQFRVKPGGQIVTNIALQSHGYVPQNAPFTVMLYSDPNNDGDPSDAVLIAAATQTSLWYYSEIEPFRMTYVAIEPTYVGEVGDVFFVGAIVHTLFLNDTWYPWAGPVSGTGQSSLRRSWYAFAPPSQGDIEDLSNNGGTLQQWTSPPFVLRAIANDCNNNGTPDMCDISSGTSIDANSNGIPDECETPFCYGDVAPFSLNGPGDGEVNVNDLLLVINNWGGCSPCYTYCEGDTNDDCLVDANDLLEVINAWGPCSGGS